MRILWHSAAPWLGTGYGQQTATIAPRLRALGHEVAISVHAGLTGTVIEWEGITVYPNWVGTDYGHQLIAGHAREFFGAGADGDLVIAHADEWRIPANQARPEYTLAARTPVAHDPAMPMTLAWFEKTGAVPIVMSRFGEQALTERGLAPLYVPHGCDTEVFCLGDKRQAREALGLPLDAFVVLIVAANRSRHVARKGFAEQIAAFAELHRRHANALLYLHAERAPSTGLNLPAVLAHHQVPEHAVRFTDDYRYARGLTRQQMARLYQAADLYSNAAYGEGFGIGIIEAQACGVPVVVTNFSAMPELCGAGWTVPCQRWWHQPAHSFYGIPNIDAITDAYLAAHSTDPTTLSAKAREFALNYDADRVTSQYWKPVLAQIAKMNKSR